VLRPAAAGPVPGAPGIRDPTRPLTTSIAFRVRLNRLAWEFQRGPGPCPGLCRQSSPAGPFWS